MFADWDGAIYKEIIIEIIEKANAIGLHVQDVVSDMGSSNQAMWREFGINAFKYSIVQNKCVHPIDSNRYLFFFHDVCHAFKNFKESMLNHVTITMPLKFVEKFNLPTNIASSKHFEEILHVQTNFNFSLASKLRKEYLETSNHFMKMKVKNACHVLNHDVSSALKFLAHVLYIHVMR